MESNKRRVISLLVDNQSGVLARVSNLFCRRGFNIDSLTVSATNDPAVSRITVTITSDEKALSQLILQTERLEVTRQVFVLDGEKSLERELLLLKVASDVHNRSELREIASIYKAKIIDLSPDSMVFELIGKPEKLDAFLKMFADYTILELCRTGVTALERGGKHEHMQKLAQDTFAKWTENYAKSSKNKYGVPAAGALVVNDPNTGEILTILSYPTYDLNTYSEKYSELSKDERTPLWNRALRSTYAIGSTSKPSVAIAAIEEGLTNRDRVIRCTREFKYLDHTFYCNINHKDRNLTLRTALQDSCNIYFYTCGEELGVSRLNEYRSMLGLGVKTGVELTEAEGIEDSPEYRESIGQTWLPGYLILSSIGEGGTRFTPIQLANYVATIANGGTRYEQHLIKSVKSADYSETLVEKTPKVALETGISKYAIDCVTEGMEYVVNNNHIIQSALKGLDVQTAAKTGTSEENRKINGVNQVINNGLYITFAPSKNAEISMAFICEGVYGSSSLAQIAKPIYEYYFNSSQTAAAPQSENTLLG